MRSTGHIATILNVTQRTVERWCSEGRIAHTRTPGGQYRIEVDEHDWPLEAPEDDE